MVLFHRITIAYDHQHSHMFRPFLDHLQASTVGAHCAQWDSYHACCLQGASDNGYKRMYA
jgi:hypothetical protein